MAAKVPQSDYGTSTDKDLVALGTQGALIEMLRRVKDAIEELKPKKRRI